MSQIPLQCAIDFMGYGRINEIGYVAMQLVLTKFRLFAGAKMDRKGLSLPIM